MTFTLNFSKRRLLKTALSTPLGACFSTAILQAEAAQTAEHVPVKIALIEAFSGAFANTGQAVFRNLIWAAERLQAQSDVTLPIVSFDSQGQVQEALSALRSAIDQGFQIIMQGNSSAIAAALIDAINKHNERLPEQKVLFLNYSAVDPSLTNEKCSPWHFRFDAHADMRLRALMQVLQDDRAIKSVYLIGQDYSFGHAVQREARRQLSAMRADVRLVGDELHPLGRIKDFAPYATKIKASGADAVLTGNFGNDLSLLIKACKEIGFEGKFYTFYGNALGAPAAIGVAGIGKVLAVADWLPNAAVAKDHLDAATQREADAFVQSFRKRYPKPEEDYVHMRMQLMMAALAQAVRATAATSGRSSVEHLAKALASSRVSQFGQNGFMRTADHQFQQSLMVGLMDRMGSPGVKYDVEGSGFGFRVIKVMDAQSAEMSTRCKMTTLG